MKNISFAERQAKTGTNSPVAERDPRGAITIPLVLYQRQAGRKIMLKTGLYDIKIIQHQPIVG